MLTDYSGPSFADLPMEIILRIMDYLSLSDVLEASLACRQFFDASLHFKFVSRLQIQFEKLQMNDTQSSPLNVFAESTRFYTKIKLNQVDLEQTSLDFWHRFGKHITDIEFNSCDLREKTFSIILNLLPNLKSLEINNCRELFMSGRLFQNPSDCVDCENVTSLSLCNNRYLSDALFNRIMSTMKHIKCINLAGCYISFHSALYRKFYPDHHRGASESVFTFYMIQQFIESHASQLKFLDFSETLIDGNALNKLSEIDDLQIEGLKLRSCDQLTNTGISKFFKKQTNLLSLDLSQSVRFTDPSLLDVCQTLTNLKVLKIRRCRAITDQSIKDIRLLTQLEYLDISECDAITSKGFIEGVANESHVRLVELHVSALNICEFEVIKLAQTLTNLRLLDLSFCKNAVTDLAVQMIFKHLTKLRTLSLEFCDMISDAGITGMEMNLKIEKFEQKVDENEETSDIVDHPVQNIPNEGQRQPYHISLRSKAEEDIVNDAKRKEIMLCMCEQSLNKEEINCSPYSIGRLAGLRSLNLASCNRISDVSLKYAFEFLELEELSLSKCQQISAIGIDSVLTHCPSIKVLNLSDCHNINDYSIHMISQRLKRLTHLYIERCSQLTDNSLDSIAMNCKRLKFLDVRGCRSMCSEPCLRLENVRSLQHILMSKPGPYVAQYGKQPKAPPLPL